MIFVALGTQDKPFTRILDYIENSNINDDVIVQCGYTEYKSSKMKLLQYIDKDTYNDYLNKADYVICHGGVGTIVNCLKLKKKVLVVPRLAKYKEHHNDHQLQIARAYCKNGYVLMMNDDDNIDEKFKELVKFEPKNFVSNNSVFVNKLNNYIINQ